MDGGETRLAWFGFPIHMHRAPSPIIFIYTNTYTPTNAETHRQPEAEAADTRGGRREQPQLHHTAHLQGKLRLACLV